jgi:hypothetical protein
VIPGLKQFRRAVLLACALSLFCAGTASAAAPCWKRLLNDWYDGHIDQVYAIPCYHQAIRHLPTDVQVYSSARDDIQRALQQAIRKKEKPGTPIPRTTTTTKIATTPSGKTTTTTAVITNPTSTTGRKKKKGVVGALDKLNPGSANSFPLPLLILGALALLLIVAGVVGMVWRRYQGGAPGAP